VIPERVGIVGAGVLGMTLALRLSQAGHHVTLLEGTGAPGGLASTQRIGGFTWDRFYHVVLPSDTRLLRLLEEVGLGESVRWGMTRTGFYTDGRLHSLSSTLEFLRFKPLSLVDKARLALTILHASRLADGQALESVPVTAWLLRWSGRCTYERIWLPLLKSKLGDNYRIASAAFIWAIIARMYSARRAGLKREVFGHLESGYESVIAALRQRLHASGVEIACGAPVIQVRDCGPLARITRADGRSHDFSRVVLTVSTRTVLSLCDQLTAAERERLGRVVYQGVVCASVLLRKPLAGFYVTNITEPGVPFTAVIEMTALTGRGRFGGHTLVYLPRYLTAADPYWERSVEEIQADFLPALQKLHPHIGADDVVAFEVARAKEVLAVATLHYTAQAMPALQTSMPNVFVANSAQIANGTLNVNETLGVAESQAQALHELWTSASEGSVRQVGQRS
jgi:protoporphyrinogen oxidase